MNPKKNVLLLVITMEKGGSERVVSLISNELAKDESIKIHIMMLEGGIDYELQVQPIVLSKRIKNNVIKFIEIPYLAWKVSKYIKENNIHTVMSFLYRPNYINILAKLLGANHRAIINIRSTTSRYLKEGLLGKVNLFLIRRLFNKSDLIISNSKGVDKDLKLLMDIITEIKVIYNPVDIEFINSEIHVCKDTDFRFKDGVNYIISVGRLIPLKRNKDLIEAFYQLQKNDNNLELIFLGDGISKNDLTTQCEDFKIKEKIHFLGIVSNPFYYLHKSNLFVINSEIEGFPNALVEAMACGLPVIASDCKSGPREILQDEKYGLLYPVGNVEILIEKMKCYLYGNMDKDEIKTKNLEGIENFKIDKIMKEFKGIL